MYLRKFTIKNIRSIASADMNFEKGSEAGWHVILGQNGSGKSSLVRAFALTMMGEREAFAAGQVFSEWLRQSNQTAEITAQLSIDPTCDKLSPQGQLPQKPINLEVRMAEDPDRMPREVTPTFTGERHKRTVWGPGAGWFSASFGPFRRFTGGDPKYERSFLSNPRLAPHLSALSESVALKEAQRWLIDLHIQTLQDEKNSIADSQAARTRDQVRNFINESKLLPHNSVISDIRNDAVVLRDGSGSLVAMDQMSDGYRSALSLVLELLRQMYALFGFDQMAKFYKDIPGAVSAPGVVAIDEVDAHLHPTWQRDIGFWLTRCFPKIQFLVTTHSPIVCRALASEGTKKGTVWLLPRPGSDDRFRQITGSLLDQLIYGDILDAYETQLFGQDVIRSKEGSDRVQVLATLNLKELEADLSHEEKLTQYELRAAFPGQAMLLPE